MELLFSFHWNDKIAVVNLYKVSMIVYEDYVELCELGCDNPSVWQVREDSDIALLRSWLCSTALGGEIFIQGAE